MPQAAPKFRRESSLLPVQLTARRRTPWRLARSAVMVLAAGVLIGLLALTFFPKQQTALAVPCTSCTPHAPEPGPARPWEIDIPVSTYSQVNTRHGNVFTAIPIVSWSGRGPDMNMMLYHNSANVAAPNTFITATGFTLGPGWSMSYSDHLLFNTYPNPTQVTVVADDGTKDVFTLNGTIWQPPLGVHDKLTPEGTNFWRLTHKNQSYHKFELANGSLLARLSQVVDATNNALILTYDNGILNRVTDASAAPNERPLNFSTNAAFSPRVLSQISDPREEVCGEPNQPECTIQPRLWILSYEANGRLEYIRDPRNNENAFVYYTSGRLAWVSDKYQPILPPELRDIDWYGYGYESGGRLNEVLDPVGGLTQEMTYTCLECTYGSGQWLLRNLYSTYTDRRGNLWQYKFLDDRYTLVPTAYLQEVTEPESVKQLFGFDQDRNLLQYCDRPDGAYNCWHSTYDGDGNLLTHTDPLNHTQSWTYGDVNNVTSFTDAVGNVTQFKYEAAAPTLLTKIIECPVSMLDPETTVCPAYTDPPITTIAYYLGTTDDGRGQVSEVIDPNLVWTGFEYDQWGQPAKYSEGHVSPNPNAVYYSTTRADSGGRVFYTSYGGSTGGGQTAASGEGGCGSAGYDADNNQTSSSCPNCIEAAGAPVPAIPEGFPRLPCNPLDLPTVFAEFPTATYNPKGHLTNLSLMLKRGTDPVLTRTHAAAFDALGRQTAGVVTSNEYGTEISRPFTHGHNWTNGTYTRTGPDGVETFVQLDNANRVQYVRRGPVATPLMTASYTYWGNDLVKTVTYPNGTSTWYTYDAARRLTRIEHRYASVVTLTLEYEYHDNGLPSSIHETGSTVPPGTTTSFSYDHLGRLTTEIRGGTFYHFDYAYDKGGNRLTKIEYDHWGSVAAQVDYTYDLDDPSLYGSKNNRLMKTVKVDAGGATLSTSWYYYTLAGNVSRIVTHEPEGAVVQNMAAPGEGVEAMSGAPGDGGVEAIVVPPPGGECPEGSDKYTATRFEYAKNGRTVTYVMGEEWCSDGTGCEDWETYTKSYLREFRYDGARARYMNRPLNTTTLLPLTTQPTVWSDYDGDEAYGDFTVASASPWTVTNINQYEPGLWRKIGATSDYLHNDHLGTLRQTTNGGGAAGASRVFTAFGERTSDTTDRFGYVGAWGYQSHSIAESQNPDAAFPYLHVGARYYDPSSGRFLQRDPIGLAGGPNVYSYAFNIPTIFVDVDGFAPINPGGKSSFHPKGAKIVVDIVKDMGQFGGGGAKYAAREAAKQAAKKAAERAGKNAMKHFRTNKAFRKFVEREYKPDVKVPGPKRNPNLTEEQMADAWGLFKQLYCGGH